MAGRSVDSGSINAYFEYCKLATSLNPTYIDSYFECSFNPSKSPLIKACRIDHLNRFSCGLLQNFPIQWSLDSKICFFLIPIILFLKYVLKKFNYI